MKIHHLNCGILHAPPNPPAACHCLLLERDGSLALINDDDFGITGARTQIVVIRGLDITDR